MTVPSIEALQAPANGQVFTLPKRLSKSAVGEAFGDTSAKADGRPVLKVVREKRLAAGTEYYCSLICFPVSGPPAFFPDSSLKEQAYGFLLLLEIEVGGKWHLGVFKQGVASIADWLDSNCNPLPRTKLVHAFSSGTAVAKMTVRRMTSSKFELRRAMYEAADLQTSLPMMAAGRNAISSIRFDGSDGSFSVTPSTSRVQRSGGRCEVDQLVKMVELVVTATNANKAHPFLETFAQAVPLAELPAGVTPNSILFDLTELLETDELELCRGNGDAVEKDVVRRLFGETLSVEVGGPGWQFGGNSAKPVGSFGKTTSKFSVKHMLSDLVYVRDLRIPNGDPVRLAKWMRDSDAYAITFSSPQYFYCGGALYFRAAFAKEVASVRQSLQPEPALAFATSEKGDTKKSDTEFPADCVFGVAEQTIYAQHDWLCCTDLGDEWSDYICVRDGKLLFIHCKAGDTGMSASAFHDVVGQGLKNLGRARSTPDDFAAKIAKSWGNKFWKGTKIRRIRGAGKKAADFTAAVKELLGNPDSGREVHLVVTMLSVAEFDAIDNAKPPAHFMQLIWFLSGFMNACRESGAKPVIVCLP